MCSRLSGEAECEIFRCWVVGALGPPMRVLTRSVCQLSVPVDTPTQTISRRLQSNRCHRSSRAQVDALAASCQRRDSSPPLAGACRASTARHASLHAWPRPCTSSRDLADCQGWTNRRTGKSIDLKSMHLHIGQTYGATVSALCLDRNVVHVNT